MNDAFLAVMEAAVGATVLFCCVRLIQTYPKRLQQRYEQLLARADSYEPPEDPRKSTAIADIELARLTSELESARLSVDQLEAALVALRQVKRERSVLLKNAGIRLPEVSSAVPADPDSRHFTLKAAAGSESTAAQSTLIGLGYLREIARNSEAAWQEFADVAGQAMAEETLPETAYRWTLPVESMEGVPLIIGRRDTQSYRRWKRQTPRGIPSPFSAEPVNECQA